MDGILLQENNQIDGKLLQEENQSQNFKDGNEEKVFATKTQRQGKKINNNKAPKEFVKMCDIC